MNAMHAVFPDIQLGEDDEGDVEMVEAWMDVKSVKEVLVEAINATKHHVGSNTVWGLYRDFMVHCLSTGVETVQSVRDMYLERLGQSHVGIITPYFIG